MNYKKGKISQQIHKDRLKRKAPRIAGIFTYKYTTNA